MTEFRFHDASSAPEGARETLAAVSEQYGFIPNLLAGLAEAPAALHAYLNLSEHFSKTSLSAQEQQVVLLSASVVNGCEFCVSAHSFIARNIASLDAANLQAIRDGTPLPDRHLDALATFTRAVVEQRGWVKRQTLNAFLDAGFSKAQALEVVTGVALKTLSNYANHLLDTPLNEQFAAERWERPHSNAA